MLARRYGPGPLPLEIGVNVGPVNHGVAAGAGRNLRRSLSLSVDIVCTHWAMALVAQSIDIGHIQQPGILRTMRCVARDAALRPDGRMLIHERTTSLRVALGADCILIRGCLEIVWKERTVGVMAIAAFDQAFIHPVMKGHIKRGLDVGMATEA